ncbi:MAG: hypothetical protein IT486_11095 [Gammaproteobacteria bacterium]|nr:hypothetical protein [Gammaproteobacteria bacterium]
MDGTVTQQSSAPLAAALTGCALLLLAACSGRTQAERSWEEFDEVTGSAVTRVAGPLVFFEDDPARAANARDYIHVAPLGVSQGGHQSRWLWVAIWSTIDRGVTTGEPAMPAVTALRLMVDGEPMDLDMTASAPAVPGVRRIPYAAPVASARVLFLPLTVSQIERLGTAGTVSLAVQREGEIERVWQRWSGSPLGLAALRSPLVPARAGGGQSPP